MNDIEELEAAVTGVRIETLKEATRLVCVWCRNGCTPDEYSGGDRYHLATAVSKPSEAHEMPCYATRIWRVISSLERGLSSPPKPGPGLREVKP